MYGPILVIDAIGYQRNKAFGYQEYLFNLLDYFYENCRLLKYEKIIIVCDLTQCADFAKYNDKFVINSYKFRSIISRLTIQMIYPYLLHLKNSDTILFTGNYSSLFKKCKYVLVIHDLLYLRKELLPNSLIRAQRNLYIPRSLAIADTIIAISDFTKYDILKHFRVDSNRKIYRVYNFFNFKKYSTMSEENLDNINNNYFLSVSSSAFHKNLITILRAYEKYCLDQPQKNDLFLVGSLGNGNALSFYNQLDNSVKDKIHILTNISNQELAKLYENCEAYISASLFEGLGMPIVEAMFFNAPIILSEIEIFREISNNHATFFNPYSFEELYQILINYKRENTNTKSFILEKFSSENTSRKYIDILNSI